MIILFWVQRIFAKIIDISIVNAQIIYNNNKHMKQSSKKPNSRDPMLISLKKLQQNIQKSEQKNLSKYSEIKRICPTFEYPLYKATIPTYSYENRQELSIAENCMLKQIDKLMEDEQKLSIQWSRQDVKAREYEKVLEKELMTNMDHFTFLRKVWKRDIGNIQQQKIDKLIHNVGAIKGHILNLIKREHSLMQSPPQLHLLITNSPQYRHLHKQNELLQQQLKQKKYQLDHSNPDGAHGNTSSLSSIESNGHENNYKINQSKVEELEKNLIMYRKQIQEQSRIIQQLRKQAVGNEYGLNGRNGDVGGVSKVCDYRVQVQGINGAYQILVRKKQNQHKEGSNGSISDGSTSPSSPHRQLRSKRSLQQILHFIQSSSQQQRLSRTSISKPINKEQDMGKKYTVEQITRAKFISNRQLISNNKAPTASSNPNININI